MDYLDEQISDDGLGAAAMPKVTIRKDSFGNTVNSAGTIIKTAAGKPVTPAQATKIKAEQEAQVKAQAQAAESATTTPWMKYAIIGAVSLIGLGIVSKLLRNRG